MGPSSSDTGHAHPSDLPVLRELEAGTASWTPAWCWPISTSFILALSESKANLTLGVLSSPESSKHMSSNSRGCHRQGCEFSKRNVVGDPEMSCWWRVHSQKTRRSLPICHQIQRLFSSQVDANCRYTGYQKRTRTFGKTKGCPL